MHVSLKVIQSTDGKKTEHFLFFIDQEAHKHYAIEINSRNLYSKKKS